MHTPHPRSAPDSRTATPAGKAEADFDIGLVQRFKAGDESAFTRIVQRHHACIRAFAFQIVHNQGDAEEVAQDTFIRAHRNLANFRHDCSLRSWLRCIGLNLARNRYWLNFRRRAHVTISIDQAVVDNGELSLASILSDGAVAPRAGSMTKEFVSLVGQCMERLDPPHRDILTMRSRLDLTYEEIAAKLSLSVGTVKSRIARARVCLREQLRQLAPEFGRQSDPTAFFETSRPLPALGGMVMA